MAVVSNVYFYFHLYFSQSKNALLLNCVCFFCPHKMAEDVNYCIKIKHFLPLHDLILMILELEFSWKCMRDNICNIDQQTFVC